jgi:hypothetical protein
VLGKSVYENNTTLASGKNSIKVDLTKFNAGVYFANTVVNNKSFTTKFVVE